MDNMYDALASGLVIVSVLLSVVLTVVMVIARWRVFEKAGEPGWASVVPFYSTYIMFKIVYGNGWKFLLCLIPYAGTVFLIGLYIRLAQVFGKGIGFGIATIFFSPITLCILAFGGANYYGPMRDKVI